MEFQGSKAALKRCSAPLIIAWNAVLFLFSLNSRQTRGRRLELVSRPDLKRRAGRVMFADVATWGGLFPVRKPHKSCGAGCRSLSIAMLHRDALSTGLFATFFAARE